MLFVLVAAQQGLLLSISSGRLAWTVIVGEDVLIAGLAFMRRLDLLYAAMVFLLPFGTILQFGSSGTGHTVLPFVGFLVTAIWLGAMAIAHTSPISFAELKWLGLFAVVMLLSALIARTPSTSLPVVQSLGSFLLMTFLTVQIVRSWRVLNLIGWVLIVSLSVVAAITIFSVLTGLHIAGTRNAVEYTSKFGTLTRYATVSGGNANDSGVLMAIGVLVSLGYLRRYRNRPTLFPLLIGAFVLLFAALVLSYSLSAIIGACVGAVIILPRASAYWGVRAAKQVCLAAAILFFLLAPASGLQQRAREQIDIVQHQNSAHWGSQRVGIWRAALQATLEHPFLGAGPGNGDYVTAQRWAENTSAPLKDGHNLYLDVGADMGLGGILVIGVLTLMPTTKLRNVLRQEPPGSNEILMRTCYASLVALLVVGLFGGLHLYPQLWLFIGLAIAVRQLAGRARTETEDGLHSTGDSATRVSLPPPAAPAW